MGKGVGTKLGGREKEDEERKNGEGLGKRRSSSKLE